MWMVAEPQLLSPPAPLSRSSSPSRSPASTPCALDADMFPSIIDAIIDHADRATRFAFRATSREHRDRVDAALCAHLEIHADGRIALTTSDGATVPCVRASAPGGARLPGLKWSAFEPGERERFLALLKYARVLDLETGSSSSRRAPGALASLGAHLTGVRTVRWCLGREIYSSAADVAPLPFGCDTLESAVTLQCRAEFGVSRMRWRQPPIGEALLSHSGVTTWRVGVHFDPEEPGLCGARIGLRAPRGVKHVRVEFRPLEPGELKRSRDEDPEPRELGMLGDAVAMAAHCIEEARFTIAINVRRCQAAWFSWPRDEIEPGELVGAVYRAVRRTATEVIGVDGVDSAMRRFKFEAELEDK